MPYELILKMPPQALRSHGLLEVHRGALRLFHIAFNSSNDPVSDSADAPGSLVKELGCADVLTDAPAMRHSAEAYEIVVRRLADSRSSQPIEGVSRTHQLTFNIDPNDLRGDPWAAHSDRSTEQRETAVKS